MAHFCTNSVDVTATEDAKLYDKFSDWLNKNKDYRHGIYPIWLKSSEHYLHDVEYDIKKSAHYFSFKTKWTPPIKDMISIAKEFKFSFIMYYEEVGSGIFGELRFDNKIAEKRELSHEDIVNLDMQESWVEEVESMLKTKEWVVI